MAQEAEARMQFASYRRAIAGIAVALAALFSATSLARADAGPSVVPALACPGGETPWNFDNSDGYAWLTCDFNTPLSVRCPGGFKPVASGEMYRCAVDA